MVDFEQLKIENQQYFERIDAKNKELLQLKLSTGKTVQVVGRMGLSSRARKRWLEVLDGYCQLVRRTAVQPTPFQRA